MSARMHYLKWRDSKNGVMLRWPKPKTPEDIACEEAMMQRVTDAVKAFLASRKDAPATGGEGA